MTERTIDQKTADSIKLYRDTFSRFDMENYLEDFTRRYARIGDNKYYGGKHCGSDAEREGSRVIYEELKNLGLDAEMIPFRTTRFQFNDASITFDGQMEPIRPYACLSYPTPLDGITAQIIDGKTGDKEFYKRNKVKGKIVILETDEDLDEGTTLITLQMYEAQKNGAAAIIVYTRSNVIDGETVRATPSNFEIKIPVVSVGYNAADLLLAKAKSDKLFTITLKVDCEFAIEGGETLEVIGEIKGRTDERIIFSSHLDHFFRCVQDNITAVATCLGIARVIKESGYQPMRTINFVFSGSHEIGRINSATPDLQGAWELIENLHPEWQGHVIADINFEYTGMEMELLRGAASYEGMGPYFDFIRYMPEKMPGYSGILKEEDIPVSHLEAHAFLAWCDACPLILKGITCYGNDAVSEQMLEPPTSPYVGRDHSNHDDFSIYSAKAHATNTDWFGALGIYLDSKLLAERDFSYRASGMAFLDEEKDLLEVENELDLTEYNKAFKEFKMKGEEVTKLIVEANDNHNISEKEAIPINRKMMALQRALADGTEGLFTSTPTMLIIPHHVYMEKDGAFLQAFDMIETEGRKPKVFKKAYEEFLAPVDLVGMGDRFSDEIINKIRDCILTENQTWNKGKCRSVYLKKDMSALRVEKTYEQNYAILEQVFADETDCLCEVNKMFDEIKAMLLTRGDVYE